MKKPKSTDPLTPNEVEAALRNSESLSTDNSFQLLVFLHRRAKSERKLGPWSTVEQKLFGDPERLVEENREEAVGLGFAASQVDGPSVDLLDFAGIEAEDSLDCRWYDTVFECGANAQELEEFEGGPGMSDTFYWVECGDPHVFARNLREYFIRLGRKQAVEIKIKQDND
jgi:hypothetical protein